jgi:hypothetical protein
MAAIRGGIGALSELSTYCGFFAARTTKARKVLGIPGLEEGFYPFA